MSKPFKLNSAFKPSGDQPEAIRRLEEGLEDGLAHQTLLGVTGSGKTFTIANVIADLQRPTMVLAPNKTLAAQLYGEMKEFFPENAVEYFVSYYDYYQPEAYVPSSDTFIEKDASVNEHIEQMRLSATKAMLERRDVVVVASVSAIYGLGDPDLYLKMMLHLTVGMIIDQRAVFLIHVQKDVQLLEPCGLFGKLILLGKRRIHFRLCIFKLHLRFRKLRPHLLQLSGYAVDHIVHAGDVAEHIRSKHHGVG